MLPDVFYFNLRFTEIQKKNNWLVDHLPNLHTPHSPSVSLQWTIRDGRLVNLPTVLLTKDDIIVMRPGQQSPAEAVALEPSKDVNLIFTLFPFIDVHNQYFRYQL